MVAKEDEDPDEIIPPKLVSYMVKMLPELSAALDQIADEDGKTKMEIIKGFLADGVYLYNIRKEGGTVTVRGADGIERIMMRWQ